MKLLEKWKESKFLPIILIVLLLLGLIFLYLPQKDSQPYNEEMKLEKLLSKIDGVGKLSVFISEGDNKGVVVICEGAKNIGVRIDILDAVATALSIPKGCISICEMK